MSSDRVGSRHPHTVFSNDCFELLALIRSEAAQVIALVYSEDHNAIVAIPLLKVEHTSVVRHRVVLVTGIEHRNVLRRRRADRQHSVPALGRLGQLVAQLRGRGGHPG